MVREADTEAEETAKKEKLEVNLTIIVNWGHQDADEDNQSLSGSGLLWCQSIIVTGESARVDVQPGK